MNSGKKNPYIKKNNSAKAGCRISLSRQEMVERKVFWEKSKDLDNTVLCLESSLFCPGKS